MNWFNYLLCFSNYLLLVMALTNSGEEISKIMADSEITPQIVPEAPSSELSVQYHDTALSLGQELTPTQVKEQPKVRWTSTPNTYYTLLMFDPDAPSKANPIFADVKHWLVGNIQGDDLSTGETIAEYMGSGPPKGTGLHRYIFLVYEQGGQLDFSKEGKSGGLSRANRLGWKFREFVQEYGLGRPIAGNFFKAQWDEYVEERNKSLK